MIADMPRVAVHPRTHYVTPRDRMERAIETIQAEFAERLTKRSDAGKLLEMQRLKQRTRFRPQDAAPELDVMTDSNASRILMAAALAAAALGTTAGTVVAVADWAHGDEPMIALLLLAGSFVCLCGSSLAAYAVWRERSFVPSLALVLNLTVLAFLSIFWRLF